MSALARLQKNLEEIVKDDYSLSFQFPDKLHTDSDLPMPELAQIMRYGIDWDDETDAETKGRPQKVMARDFIKASVKINGVTLNNFIVQEVADNLLGNLNMEGVIKKGAFVFEANTKASMRTDSLGLYPLIYRVGVPLVNTGELSSSLTVEGVKS